MMRTTTPILSFIIAILIFVFFTHPQYTEVRAIQHEIDEYREATQTYEEFSEKLKEKLATKTSRSALEVEQLNILVPEDIDETKHLISLEAMAERNNLLFSVGVVNDKEVTFSEPVDDGMDGEAPPAQLTSLDISFEVVGTYEQFKKFLKELERSRTIFEVTQLTFSVEEGQFQRFSVTVRTYALISE